jgi:hypothetical protein
MDIKINNYFLLHTFFYLLQELMHRLAPGYRYTNRSRSRLFRHWRSFSGANLGSGPPSKN